MPTIAIVGRTNVGKSTLFNQIAGKRLAVVQDVPGVTRDRAYAVVTRHSFPFTLIDTGGFAGEEDSPFAHSVRAQAEMAVSEADAVIVLFDGLHGAHPLDEEVVRYLRTVDKPVFWVLNKCESPKTELMAGEIYGMGVDTVRCISAAHNQGIRELLVDIRNVFEQDECLALDEAAVSDQPVRVAILGKPNVGKSTLTNKILGEERVITSDISGTTRDSVDVHLSRDGQDFTLIDTAGLRRKNKIDKGSIERFSNLRSLRAMAQSDVAVILLDATEEGPREQDKKIAGLVHDRGIPFILVVNKWDAVEKDHRSAREFMQKVYDEIKFAKYAPVLFISALTGKRCPSVLEHVKAVYEASRVRIQTSELNDVMRRAFHRKPPPVVRGQPIKLFYAAQVDVAPPSFVLFVNHPNKVNFSYQRYLKNELRKHFPYPGSNIKLMLRKRKDSRDSAAA